VAAVTGMRDPGPYRLTIRELVRRVEGDPDRLRLMLDRWQASLSTVELNVNRNDLLADRHVLDVLKHLLLASVRDNINRIADEELQCYRQTHSISRDAVSKRHRAQDVGHGHGLRPPDTVPAS
jgi:hypothetical protein